MKPITIHTLRGLADPKEAFRAALLSGISAPPHRRLVPSGLSYLASAGDEGESTELDGFQQIMETQEYYQTDAEIALLTCHASQMALMLGELRKGRIQHLRIAERGPGDGRKTWLLLAALDAAEIPFTYFGIDCSMRALKRFQASQPPLSDSARVQLFCGEADRFLADRTYREDTVDVLIDFGGNIGNGDPSDALTQALAVLPMGGVYLVGWHSREVEPARILLAYNDPQGVTEQFILNALRQANRLYGGDFRLGCFEYSPSITKQGTVVMALRSLRQQAVRLTDLGLMVTLREDEFLTISTSRKWFPEEFSEWITASGLGVKGTFASPKRKTYITAVMVPYTASW